MDTLRQDLRYAVRLLLHSPVFTLVTAVTLAIGIGGTTTAFSLVNAVLLRPLPVAEPDRLASVALQVRGGPGVISTLSFPDYEAYRDRNRVFSDLAAVGMGSFGLSTGGPAEAIGGSFVSGNYFRTLGIRPALGRFITPEDDRQGGTSDVAVLSHGLWRKRFGEDPAVLNRTIRLNGREVTVVGVAPATFAGTELGVAPELWVPLEARRVLAPGLVERPGMRISWLQVLGRLREGMTRERAQSELSALARHLTDAGPQHFPVVGVELTRVGSAPPFVRGIAMGVMALLLGTSGMVLLIASTNVAGMLLARATARRREIAIRLAMGARPGRIVRQLLTESVLLSLLGCAGGVLLAHWIAGAARGFRAPVAGPAGGISIDITPDVRVLGFALAVSLLSGVLFGLAPALQAVRPQLVAALKDATPGAGRRSRLRDVLVAGQIALSLLLLLAAGLFLRSLQKAMQVDPGFDAQGVLVAQIDLEPHGYTRQSGAAFHRSLLEQLRATPGVEAASLSLLVPLSGAEMQLGVQVPGRDEPESVRFNLVGDDYFRAMRTAVVQGRALGARDREGAPPVAMVNEAFAREYWPGRNPLGQRVELAGPGGRSEGSLEVVGVVRDGKFGSLGERPTPMVYRPLAQSYNPMVWVLVRTAGDPAALAPTLSRIVQQMNPAVALGGVQPLTTALSGALLPQRMGAAVAGTFGLIGLLLAAVGLYGVMAFAVAQRTREIGIRTALGAQTTDTVRLVLRHALVVVAAGIALGTLMGLGTTRFLAGMLFGVSATDPVAYGGVVTLLVLVALVASLIPARRASRVDPNVALRYE